MKFTSKIIQLMVTGAVGSTVALNLLPIATNLLGAKAVVELAQALSPEEINLRAKQIVVRIDGANTGSGSIIEASDNTYTVLTNWHVMKNQGSYVVQTIDGRKHQVDPATVKRLPGVDLATFQFNSQQNYQTAELGDSSNLSEGQNVYFAGYPGELRREDNRYYRFFTANLVGILPKSTENGYSLVYSGEAFPGMSGSPVLSKNGLMIGVHGEANIHALSGGTSNYAIAINSYQQAIAKLNQPTAEASQTATTPQTTKPEVEPPATTENNPTPVETNDGEANNEADNSEQPPTTESTESLDAANISSVPTFSNSSSPKTPTIETEPEIIVEPQTEPKPTASKPENQPEIDKTQATNTANKPESAATKIPTASTQPSLVSDQTGIDYTKLQNLLQEKKWSEADIHTYRLIEQVVKTAKRQKKNVFIELKTIAEFACPDVRTIDYLWKKYSNNKFGFSPQQEVWQSVNQEGDFSTQTWRRFATKVGWKKGEVDSGSGYLLYEQLDFEPTNAPAGHLPWWFALPDEEQKVIKSLFARCNFDPSVTQSEADAANFQNTAQNSLNNPPDINELPKFSNNKARG